MKLKDLYFWANYFTRRFLRIFPLFVFILFLSYIFTKFFSSYTGGVGLPFTIKGEELVRHLILQAGKSVLWSIPVEFKYYFILPVIAILFAYLKDNFFLASTIFVLSILVVAYSYPIQKYEENTYSLAPYLPLFIMGSYTAFVHSFLEIHLPRKIKGYLFQRVLP